MKEEASSSGSAPAGPSDSARSKTSLALARALFCCIGILALIVGGVCVWRMVAGGMATWLGQLCVFGFFALLAVVWFYSALTLGKTLPERSLRAAWYLAVILTGPGLLFIESVVQIADALPIFELSTVCLIVALPAAEFGCRAWLRPLVQPTP